MGKRGKRTPVISLEETRKRLEMATSLIQKAVQVGGGEAFATRPNRVVARLPAGTAIEITIVGVTTAEEEVRNYHRMLIERDDSIPDWLRETIAEWDMEDASE